MAEATDLERAVLEELRRLPEDDQRQVLAYATSKRERRDRGSSGGHERRRSLRGLWAGLGITIDEEDIGEARREAWRNLSRQLPLGPDGEG